MDDDDFLRNWSYDPEQYEAFTEAWQQGDATEAANIFNAMMEEADRVPRPMPQFPQRPSSPLTMSEVLDAGNEASNDRFRPLRLDGDSSSRRVMNPLGYEIQAQLRDGGGELDFEDADDALHAASAINLAREVRLAREYEAQPPRLIYPDRPIVIEGVDEDYGEDEPSPARVYNPVQRNREGIKYGISKEGRAYRHDPCSFASYEEYERDAKRRRVTFNSRPPRWTREEWQRRCVERAEPIRAPAGPKRPKGRVPDYVSILDRKSVV